MDDEIDIEGSLEKELESKITPKKELDELQERVKELNCIYGISEIVNDKSLSLEEALQKIIELIPPSWQYEDIACARIKIEDEVYKTDNFQETKWKQQSIIEVEGEMKGSLEVYYLEEKPEEDEGPFLIEERRLLNTISDFIGRFIEERKVKEKISDEKQDWEVIIDL
ncbi:MAG: sensor histidine kinase, partial [Candidatus Saliniplasma sp.]